MCLHAIITSFSLKLVRGFGRWLTNHGQIAERPALSCGMCFQVKRPVIRLIFRFDVGIVDGRIALGLFILGFLARHGTRQQVRQITEFRRRRIPVERRGKLAILDSRHQMVHEVIPESHVGQGLVARQQFVHPTVDTVLVCVLL